MKLNVLISIKPRYVKEILNGNKIFEYRKCIFKKEIDKVYIYSTSPEQRIVGYFEYTGYLKDTPANVWESTKLMSGIDEEAYNKYFNDKDVAYAIKIDKIYKFKNPVNPKTIFNKFTPPQSYMYIEGDIY